ncbi:MAG: single-stranded DNA-binding protein [Sphingobacteriales bacterium]|nr:single-stranded DNA-binding protein [Sphingobacteriales bacterium]
MSSLNKVMLIGRLGKDPEAYHFDSGRIKVSFPLATSDSYTNKEGVKVEETEWHNVVMWGKQAEIAEKYLRKGKLVFIEGRIKTRTWDDKDGNKRYTTEVEAAVFTMLSTVEGGGGGHEERNGGGTRTTPPPQSNDNPDVDDLPF